MGKISRRKFVVRTILGGTGVILGTTYLARNPLRRAILDVADGEDALSYMGDVSDPMLWFEIKADNIVRILSPKVEMGQGTFTSLVQIAADELEMPIEQVEIVHAPTASGNIDGMSTGGSTSVAGLFQPLRELSATMREMIRIEGAKQLGADLSSTKTKDGFVISGSNRTSYGEVVSKITSWTIPETPQLKDVSNYKYIGKPVPRVDLADKVYGTPIFGIDAEMPDMLYASIVRPEKIWRKACQG